MPWNKQVTLLAIYLMGSRVLSTKQKGSLNKQFNADCRAPISNSSRVTGLRLEPNAGYTGPLSPAIGNLTALQQLAISENAFHGHIPGNCRHLFHLDLSMNSFTGRLPESLSLLSSLIFLSVAFNSLQGPIPNLLQPSEKPDLHVLGQQSLQRQHPISHRNVRSPQPRHKQQRLHRRITGPPHYHFSTRPANQPPHWPPSTEPQELDAPPGPRPARESPNRHHRLLPLHAPESANTQPLTQRIHSNGGPQNLTRVYGAFYTVYHWMILTGDLTLGVVQLTCSR